MSFFLVPRTLSVLFLLALRLVTPFGFLDSTPFITFTHAADPSGGLGVNGMNGDLLTVYSDPVNTPWRYNDVLYLHGILHYPNGFTLNGLTGVDTIYPSQAWEDAVGEYLNLPPGHVRMTSQVRPLAEWVYLSGQHGGTTLAAVNRMYMAYLGTLNAQLEEAVEPGVYVNFIISTNRSDPADLQSIRETALHLFHLDFTDPTILTQYQVPWVLQHVNTQLGMWSQQVGYCAQSTAVGEEAPQQPQFYQTYIEDWGNPNAVPPIQAESTTELIFDPSCIPSSPAKNAYGYGFGFSFSIVSGFVIVGYLIALDTKLKRQALEKKQQQTPK